MIYLYVSCLFINTECLPLEGIWIRHEKKERKKTNINTKLNFCTGPLVRFIRVYLDIIRKITDLL